MQGVGHVPRAPRFAVRAPARYRRRGDTSWTDGDTVDISRSGVLIAGTAFTPGEPIEVRVVLSAADPNVADLWAHGRVVRVERHASGADRMAATIDGYRLTSEARLPGTGFETDEDV